MATGDLVTIDEFLAATGQLLADQSAQELAKAEWAISTASTAVRQYANRDFTLSTDAVQGTRTYRYYGNSIVDIDDAAVVSAVSIAPTTFSSSRTLDTSEWFAMPQEEPILTYIEFFTLFLPSGASPQMGFQRNLDTYPYVPYPILLTVNAVWGWPVVPWDVKMATVFGAKYYMTDQASVASESIAGYSRSYGGGHGSQRILPGQIVQALPDRAIALLDPYSRWQV